MPCPACSGKGFRLLRIAPDQGLCATCGGAGSVQDDKDSGGQWMFKVAPCSDCGGGGLRPLQYGGTRDGLEQVGGRTLSASPGGSMSPGGGSRDGETDESEPQTSDEDDASSDESFFSRYRTWLLIAAGAVLIVGLIGIKSSKK